MHARLHETLQRVFLSGLRRVEWEEDLEELAVVNAEELLVVLDGVTLQEGPHGLCEVLLSNVELLIVCSGERLGEGT